ncbi:glycosyltransferase family 4 protein [Candidatus Uhrbacteria bacterium]|nr:glycosyltransferase family 4 protein [Candidatus Uhrbacteria bacterium]
MLSAETGELAGTAHYTYELVRHLLDIDKNNTYVLFFYGRAKTVGYPSPSDGIRHSVMDWAGDNVEIIFLPISRMPLLTTHYYLAHALRRAKLDVFYSPAHPLPLGYRGKSVCTVHDLAIYDHPEWFPRGLRQWFSTRVTVPRSMRRAEKLLAVSENTKRDIMRIFNVSEEKVRVIHEGAIASPAKQSYDRSEIATRPGGARNDGEGPYFLFIGTIEPRKNIVRLINAFIRFRSTIHDSRFTLILAGGIGWKNDEIFMAMERANVKLGKGSVQYLGYVSEEEKIALLQNATAFVWPSLYEGFGLPVLEAMAAGVPVITSNVSSIPEITGDAALLVNPENVGEIVTAMEQVANDAVLREQLKTRGVNRAKKFTWQEAARETLAVYQSVL